MNEYDGKAGIVGNTTAFILIRVILITGFDIKKIIQVLRGLNKEA